LKQNLLDCDVYEIIETHQKNYFNFIKTSSSLVLHTNEDL